MRTYRGPSKPLVKTEYLLHKFWSKVSINNVGCWEWQGHRQQHGYGILELRGTPRLAHRISYWLRGNEIDGACVLHRCDNPPCVRPSHLFAGTRSDNAKDRNAKGRTVNPIGPANGMARLTVADIPEIRALISEGTRIKQIAQRFGVGGGTIRAIRDGVTWKHVSAEPGE
jgi:hypothetical protein